ncbi:hypothetical protein M405DRAFT_128364 [Rhizopogon salebrosus TDB-379]|nr:hypothetical protein M405DRAFT_128364 [Rhizopogon salebrosus TDB-379]
MTNLIGGYERLLSEASLVKETSGMTDRRKSQIPLLWKQARYGLRCLSTIGIMTIFMHRVCINVWMAPLPI